MKNEYEEKEKKNKKEEEEANTKTKRIKRRRKKKKRWKKKEKKKKKKKKKISKLSKVDVLKVGHHGSSTSTAEAFLKKVDPTYAVILCGIDNKYGHPHRETMAKLQGIEVHRSDECGDIIFKSTGNGVVTSCNVGSYIPGSDKELNTTNSSNTSSNADASYEADANTELEKKEPVVGSTEVVYWTPNGKS